MLNIQVSFAWKLPKSNQRPPPGITNSEVDTLSTCPADNMVSVLLSQASKRGGVQLSRALRVDQTPHSVFIASTGSVRHIQTHDLDPASVFLSKIGLFFTEISYTISWQKRRISDANPGCNFYLSVSVCRTDFVKTASASSSTKSYRLRYSKIPQMRDGFVCFITAETGGVARAKGEGFDNTDRQVLRPVSFYLFYFLSCSRKRFRGTEG